MHPTMRERFNADFTPQRYDELLRIANETERWPVDFRISESPIFLSPAFTNEVQQAAEELVRQVRTPEFAEHARDAIPPGLEVPDETPHPIFLQVDFAICEHNGRLTPRLIELQGFPSLYGFQIFVLRAMRHAYPVIPADWHSFFNGYDERSYLDLLRQVIVGNSDPENVVLLEIEPEKQNTRIDFACTETLLGVAPVSLTEVERRGDQLFYQRDGRDVRIERIYNRVIFDELLRRPDLSFGFNFQHEIDVAWVGHPNWYSRISKHSLPFLKTPHTSRAYFADEFPSGENPADFVLKPLYSFAGLGVDLEPTPEKLAALPDPHTWILQEKVNYADFVPTPDGPRSKAEIRMMFIWPQGGEPVLVNNLVRMSQGAMMGVKFNKNKSWVGSSIALREA
ncbi:MAG TPA: hypothetical protein VK993_03335 [Chthoniobacterales bacterium]|nr:hypothetical protein [Chthoniobacterales bacterium]